MFNTILVTTLNMKIKENVRSRSVKFDKTDVIIEINEAIRVLVTKKTGKRDLREEPVVILHLGIEQRNPLIEDRITVLVLKGHARVLRVEANLLR